ncbi:ABC transporter substrate-binding protein [Alkalicoccobacillus murimartini]|uniref:ABC transporter substrate-binding protein n=1 Tax=Alkalicoccobacillus murimartini TaxID=171685 RepID=UPI0027D7BBF3|nr:ABC transporter substrate-binding protein [Alkalicoccobacillus murimartini]
MQGKKYVQISLFVCSVLIVSGCQTGSTPEETDEQPSEQVDETGYPLDITDAIDQELTINEEPQKIVSLIPSNTEIVYALGAGEVLVGRSDFDDYPEEVLDVQSIGGMEFDTEQIIELEPDLILAHESGVAQAENGFEQLESAGYPVFVVDDAQTIDEVYETIEQIGQLLNRQIESDELIEEMKDRFSDLSTQTEKDLDTQRSVWVEISPQPIYVAGKETFMDELLQIGHAKNAAEEITGWAEVSEETGITSNPDVIISTYFGAEDIKERPGWTLVSAHEEDRIYDIDPNIVSRPGPRLVEGAEKLAEYIYPDDF